MKDKLDIGIDIDGTVADFVSSFVPYGKIMNPMFDREKITDYDMGFPRDVLADIFRSWENTGEYSDMEVLRGAVGSVNQIGRNANIHFITVRDFYPGIHQETEDWLDQKGFKYQSLHTGQRDKYPIIKELGIDMIIDDNPHFAEDLARKGVPVILYDQPWNRDVEGSKIKRCKSWKEIERFLKNEKNNRR